MADRNVFVYRNIRSGMGESGIVVALITAVIPRGLLSRADLMKRKSPLGESGAEQNKSARSRAFRTDSDFGSGSERKSLPEIATVGTKQSNINAREQQSLRAALRHYRVGRKLMRRIGR